MSDRPRAHIQSDPTNPNRKLRLHSANITEEDIQSVFSWLSVWEVAAPLKSYSHLAIDEGTPEERKLTASVVGDLRQMLYDSRAIWFRADNERAQKFLDAFDRERKRCKCEKPCELAFLRALWKVKPRMLALPTGFIQPEPVAPTPLK
ncbi:hypothetical protein LCGC14_1240350 [marine sediment metagenome]|uniref:Uncharacterized protein n=1 Tax=marine sediment metagenome TaxID=412755 RepID=A0A0F9NN95_9ZZZZ